LAQATLSTPTAKALTGRGTPTAMPVGGLLARGLRLASGESQSISAELRRITESAIIDIPEELFPKVIEATHNPDDRQTIMLHLMECLSEASGRRWKRVHAGLVLAEMLVQHGDYELLVETAEGRYFDLVQRLSFLEHFERSSDRGAQNLVRKKAAALRARLVPMLQAGGSDLAAGQGKMIIKDTLSTCSPKTSSTVFTSLSSDMPWPDHERASGPVIVNGIVAVGHTDDTTSGSSDDEAPRHPTGQRAVRKSARQRQSEATGGEACAPMPAAPTPTAPASTVDLLDL